MSNEILRGAAAAMRERAEAATPGTWMLDPDEEVGTAEVIVEEYERHEVARISCDFWTDAAHIASWRPAVALAVADHLEAMAAVIEEAEGTPLAIVVAGLTEKSTAIALAYLGEEA